MHLAAKQVIDRLADRLADNIPQRHLDAGEHADQRNIGPLRIAAPVNVAPNLLDVERVGAEHVFLEHVAHEGLEYARAEARGIDLAEAFDAIVGDQFDKQEIAPAARRGRIADDEGFQIDDLHCAVRPPSTTISAPVVNADSSLAR